MFDVLPDAQTEALRGLEEVERRVLWLATLIVHEANKRKDPAGIKVGGHQASSASCVRLPHNLAFIGTALNVRAISLGVSGFGESGTVADLFRKHALHPDSIVNTAIAVTHARVRAGQLS